MDLGGFRDNVLWVRIAAEKLFSRSLALQDVVDAIKKNHIESHKGKKKGKAKALKGALKLFSLAYRLKGVARWQVALVSKSWPSMQ